MNPPCSLGWVARLKDVTDSCTAKEFVLVVVKRGATRWDRLDCPVAWKRAVCYLDNLAPNQPGAGYDARTDVRVRRLLVHDPKDRERYMPHIRSASVLS